MNKWHSLSSRERGLVILAVFSIVALTIYIGYLEPRYQKLERLRGQVPEQQETLEWMKKELAAVRPLLKQGKRVRSGESIPLLSLIEQTATQMKLRQSIRRMQPGEDNQVKVWLSNIYFDPWIRWVHALGQKGIEALDTSINREENNQVSIRVTFQRAQ